MKRVRQGLMVLALGLFPLSALVGGLLYLLWWLLPGAVPEPQPLAGVPRLSGRVIRAWILALIALSLLTCLTCAVPLWQLAGWLSRYALPALLIWGTYRTLNSGRLQPEELVGGLLLGSLLLALIGLGNYFLHWQSHPQLLCSDAYGRFCLLDLLLLAEDRARGFSMHPNVLGMLLAISLPLWIQWLAQVTVGKKALVGLALGLVLLCLAVSYSRAAWLGGGLALLLACLWLLQGSWRKGLLLMLPVAGLVLSLRLGQLLPRLTSLLAAEGSHHSRLLLWQAGGQMLGDHLWLGTGLLQVEPLLPLYLAPIAGGAGHLHNWFLQVAVESGLPAALLLFGLLAYLLGTPRQLSTLGQACWLSWAGFALASLFDATILDLRVAFELSLLLGLLPSPAGRVLNRS